MLPILTAALLLGAPPPMPSEKTADRELLPMPRRLDDSTAQLKTTKQIEFQNKRVEALRIRRAAEAEFIAGRTDAAIKMLADCLVELKKSALDPADLSLLRRPIEHRLETFYRLESSRILDECREQEERRLGRERPKPDIGRLLPKVEPVQEGDDMSRSELDDIPYLNNYLNRLQNRWLEQALPKRIPMPRRLDEPTPLPGGIGRRGASQA
jgi:hypothetical protein